LLDGPILKLESINQIGFVVPDLERAMEAYWRCFGIGPWRVYTYGYPLVKDTTYRGKKEDYRIRLALAEVGDLVVELIQHLDGNTVHKEFLQRSGKGIQHLGLFVDNIDVAVKQMQEAGFEVVQTGKGYGADGDGAYAYVDAEQELGVMYELIQLPAQRVQPEQIYPSLQTTLENKHPS
jgi:methylmalonyl-CoA/ethylmalonyl-CoA epimerase